MRKRRFGRTGLLVSELVFGGGWVGGILIHAEEAVRLQALRRAVAAGIDWVDTAALYGNGVSEETIGRLLPEVSPRPRLSTKVRLDPAAGDIAGQIECSLEASLGRLKAESVELFILHNPIGPVTDGATIGEAEVLGPGGVAETFEALRARGRIRWTGLTALGDSRACGRVMESGRFDVAQVYYNLLNPTAAMDARPTSWAAHDFSGLLATARAQDMGVMAIRILAAGVLATKERHGREAPIYESAEVGREEARAATVLGALGERYGTPAQTAIRFGLGHPDISCIVVGLAELAHLEEALIAERLGPLPSEAMAMLDPLWRGAYSAL